jgi:hypothetical protein
VHSIKSLTRNYILDVRLNCTQLAEFVIKQTDARG